MVWKCKHGVIAIEKYCLDCNKRPVILRPGQSIGNRPPNTIIKMDKR